MRGKDRLNHKVLTLHPGFSSFPCIPKQEGSFSLLVRGTPLLKDKISFYPSNLTVQCFHRKEKEIDEAIRNVSLNSRCPGWVPGPPESGAPASGCVQGLSLCLAGWEQGAWLCPCPGRGQGHRVKRGAGPRSALRQGRKAASVFPSFSTHTCSWATARSELRQLAEQRMDHCQEAVHSVVVPMVM